MISPVTVNIILWAPVAVIFLVSALIFCISGYKKGLWHGLISLGITVVSAVISFFGSKLVAGMVAPGIVASVEASLPAGDAMVGIVKSLLPSLVQAVLAVAFFAGIFFVITLICKIVGNIVVKKAFSQLLNVEKPAFKWGGLGVRAVDAIVYTILFLLPLYGTIGAYAPTVQTVLGLAGGEETAIISEYLGVIAKHPMVALTGSSLFGDIYTGLMDTSGPSNQGGGTNVNVGEVVDAMDKAMSKFDAMQKAETPEEAKAATVELIKHLKDNVVEADWSYDIIQQTTTVLKDEIVNSMQGASAEEVKAVETVVGMLDMSKEEFQENGVVILDFVEFAIQNDTMENISSGNMAALQTEEFYEEAATFLNATDKTTDIKKYLLTETMTQVFNGDTETANKIMESYDDSAVATPEAQQQEIEALLAVTTATNQEELMAALGNIPTLDSKVIEDALKNLQQN